MTFCCILGEFDFRVNFKRSSVDYNVQKLEMPKKKYGMNGLDSQQCLAKAIMDKN